MNKEDIIRMAREADIDPHDMCEDPRIAVHNLERFAALVAATEREACAQLCEEHQYEWTYGSTYATGIRARSQQ